jgi:hypothetical protein
MELDTAGTGDLFLTTLRLGNRSRVRHRSVLMRRRTKWAGVPDIVGGAIRAARAAKMHLAQRAAFFLRSSSRPRRRRYRERPSS